MKQRNKRGSVGIEVKNGKLRLRLPRTTADVNARYISTGLDDTPDNRRKAQVKAWEIEEDIQHGRLDTTLSRYKFQQPTVIITRPNALPDLCELWSAYCKHRKPLVAITTYRNHYMGYCRNHISRLPSRSINDAVVIRNYLVDNHTVDVAKRVLTQINACCKWALSVGLIDNNPFVSMANELKQTWSCDDIDPFTRSERDAIIQAYKIHPTYNYYYNFIRFLFYTGCRPGEACALKWKHISDDHISFTETYNARHHLTKETKTGKTRRFPINSLLAEVLKDAKISNCPPEAYVFTTHHYHKPISNEKIPRLLGWQHILGGLVSDGLVKRYRPPYNTRHTFITLALEAGLSISQVATLVGNTPIVILKHYAGGNVADVPVF